MSEQIYYRLLNKGEIIQEGDEFFDFPQTWSQDSPSIGRAWDISLHPYRRPCAPFQWIPVEERLPTAEDGDSRGEVFALLEVGGCVARNWRVVCKSNLPIAWAKIPPYVPPVPTEEKEFEVWVAQKSSEPTNSPAWKLAKDAWMAAKKGGKA